MIGEKHLSLLCEVVCVQYTSEHAYYGRQLCDKLTTRSSLGIWCDATLHAGFKLQISDGGRLVSTSDRHRREQIDMMSERVDRLN